MIEGTTPTFILTITEDSVDLTQVTVNAIPYVETANSYGITVTIG